MELIIRTENEDNFEWLQSALGSEYNYVFKDIPLPEKLSGRKSKVISDFHNLPLKIKDLLKFDKTDFIISRIIDDVETPIISIEITKSAPLSQHIEQRMPRMISAAELGIVPIFICPKELKKENGTSYKFSKKFYNLYNKIGTINKLPCVIFNYPDIDGVLVNEDDYPECPQINSASIINFIKFIKTILTESIKIKEIDFNYFNNSNIKKVFNDQYLLSENKKYDLETMGTCELIPTDQLLDYIKNYSEKNSDWIEKTFNEISLKIKQRKKSLIFFPGKHRKLRESRLFNHSGDPYVGMLSALDYAFCRIGKSVDDRNTNLIFIPGNKEDSYFEKIFASQGFNKFYEKDCPFKITTIDNNLEIGVSQQFKISHHLQYGCTYSKIRPLKIYSHYCDLIVFKDALLSF